MVLQIIHRRPPAVNMASTGTPRAHANQELSRNDSFSSRRSNDGERPHELISRGPMDIYELEDPPEDWQQQQQEDGYEGDEYADTESEGRADGGGGGGYAQWRQGRHAQQQQPQQQVESVGDRLYHKAEELQRQRNADVLYKVALSNTYDANGQPLFQVQIIESSI